jgi:hypothetical protein
MAHNEVCPSPCCKRMRWVLDLIQCLHADAITMTEAKTVPLRPMWHAAELSRAD